jgi:hypothetical protein
MVSVLVGTRNAVVSGSPFRERLTVSVHQSVRNVERSILVQLFQGTRVLWMFRMFFQKFPCGRICAPTHFVSR